MKFNELFNFDNLGKKLSIGLGVALFLVAVVSFIGVFIDAFGFIIIPIVFITAVVLYIIGSIVAQWLELED